MELLDVVCQYLPHCIDENMFMYMNSVANYDVINVLNKYYQKISNDRCYICFGSYESELINSICDCKTFKVHISCLINIVKKIGHTCGVCKKSFKPKVDNRERIFFPFSNLYRDPLCSNMHVIPIDDITNTIMFAVGYLVLIELNKF